MAGRFVRPETVRRRADFLAANRGLRVARPGFVLLVNPRGDAAPLRFGVTVTRKIGNAVVRNRMKRRFRALLRELLPELGIAHADHVLIGREGGVERDFATLRRELGEALARAAAGKGDPPRRRHGGKTADDRRHGGKLPDDRRHGGKEPEGRRHGGKAPESGRTPDARR